MTTIITSECVNCQYGTLDDTDKSKVKIHCDYKDKDYYYGQYVPCDVDNKNKRKKDV